MKTVAPSLLLVGLLAGSLACAAPRPAFAPPVPPGGTLYTQFTLQQERGRYRTTNYRRGELVPVNTEVRLVAVTRDEIVVDVASTGARLRVENVPKHTYQSLEQAFHDVFGTGPVDLSGYDEEVQAAIRGGRAEPGMSREAVLLALGPPPAVGTPNRASPEWVYWDSRFTKFAVHFDADGRVAGLED